MKQQTSPPFASSAPHPLVSPCLPLSPLVSPCHALSSVACRMQMVATTENPEAKKRQDEIAWEDSKRLQARQAQRRQRADGLADGPELTASFLDDDDDGNLDGNLGALKRAAKAGRGLPKKGGGAKKRPMGGSYAAGGKRPRPLGALRPSPLVALRRSLSPPLPSSLPPQSPRPRPPPSLCSFRPRPPRRRRARRGPHPQRQSRRHRPDRRPRRHPPSIWCPFTSCHRLPPPPAGRRSSTRPARCSHPLRPRRPRRARPSRASSRI